MTGLPHQLIEPSAFCRRHPLHRIEQRNKGSASGLIEYCYTCSLGYEQVLVASDGDEDQATRFVESLRS